MFSLSLIKLRSIFVYFVTFILDIEKEKCTLYIYVRKFKNK